MHTDIREFRIHRNQITFAGCLLVTGDNARFDYLGPERLEVSFDPNNGPYAAQVTIENRVALRFTEDRSGEWSTLQFCFDADEWRIEYRLRQYPPSNIR